MPSQINFLLLGVICLGTSAIICAAIAWSHISQLSLPLPRALPALNILIPLLTAFTLPLSRRLVLRAKQRAVRATLPYLAHASTLLPFILLTLSLIYATPGDIQSCSIDRHWLRMFEAKNDRAIRNIQINLQCCGLNSLHDRAWPFPSRDVDARACERTQGYTMPCGGRWRHEETVAATLTAMASFLNWLAMVLIVIHHSSNEGRITLPTWLSSSPTATTRLIEDEPSSAERRTIDTVSEARSEQQRLWEET